MCCYEFLLAVTTVMAWPVDGIKSAFYKSYQISHLIIVIIYPVHELDLNYA